MTSPAPSTSFGAPAVQYDEHKARVLTFRRTIWVALAAWLLYGIGDFLIVMLIETEARLWLFWGVRAVGAMVIFFIALIVQFYRNIGPRLLRFVEVVGFFTASLCVSITCVDFGGITSPLTLGIVTIIACRVALAPDRWQRELLPVGLTCLIHPVVLVALGLVSPDVRAQLTDVEALSRFALNQTFLFGTAGLTVIGTHRIWALRQQVYGKRSLGRYKLLRQIGKGGFGEVWVAHHQALKQDVAVKIIRADAMDENARERFEREVRMTSELTHPNTIRVFDYGVSDDGLLYFVMELLEGRDLAEIIDDEGLMDPLRAARIVLQASRALAEAHARGVIHRDIKPANLFVTGAGVDEDIVKVLDFGVARTEQPGLDDALTQTGFVVGTPSYCAPEVLLGKPATPAADVYALGSVLHKLVVGEVPQGTAGKVDLAARLHEDVERVSSEGLVPELEAVILCCLRRDLDRRYDSAAALAQDLARAIALIEQRTAVGGTVDELADTGGIGLDVLAATQPVDPLFPPD